MILARRAGRNVPVVSDESQPLGDAQGQWYWCFEHQKVERFDECNQMDRMGPYPTADDAAHWRDRVAERNRAWDDEDD